MLTLLLPIFTPKLRSLISLTMSLIKIPNSVEDTVSPCLRPLTLGPVS